MAATDPGMLGRENESGISTLELVSALDPARATEVCRVGAWSVRKLGNFGLIYINTEENRVEVQPPPEVLHFLHLDADGADSAAGGSSACGADGAADDIAEDCASIASGGIASARGGGDDDSTTDAAAASAAACGSRPGSSSGIADGGSHSLSGGDAQDAQDAGGTADSPRYRRFQRIVLGARCDVPLKMARDILEALREDHSIFTQVQQRFSDAPDEPVLGLGDGGLGEELQDTALALAVGEISDVVGTEAGMHILLRVS